MSIATETGPLRSSAVEDYSKAIYGLQERDGRAVSTTALAERLGVTAASASGMVKRLCELGLVTHRRYRSRPSSAIPPTTPTAIRSPRAS